MSFGDDILYLVIKIIAERALNTQASKNIHL